MENYDNFHQQALIIVPNLGPLFAEGHGKEVEV
jgi:hypothetical protein